MFDVDNPPLKYRAFRKEVLRSVEEADIEPEEAFEPALFIVDNEAEGHIIDIHDIAEEEELGPETPVEFIVQALFPYAIKKLSARMFAFVFGGTYGTDDDDEYEIVSVVCGDINVTEMYIAQVIREDDMVDLEPWTEESVFKYQGLIQPFRHAITWQG